MAAATVPAAMTDPDLAEIEGMSEAEELRKQLYKAQQALADQRRKTRDIVEAAREGARAAFLAAGPPAVVKPPKQDRRKQDAEVCWAHCSDWHFGKLTPSFNSDVAYERSQRYAQKIVEMTEIERADHPVHDGHFLFNGDFVEGVGIFPGQAWEIEHGGVFQQVMNAARAIEGFIRIQLACFDTVHVWLQTGNHGRIGRKGDMPQTDNTDRFLYQIVMERFSDYGPDRLVWHAPENWYTIATVGNYRQLLVHGNQIKSFGGTPVFAILKKCNSWASGVLPPFRDVAMGHFHTELKLQLANGAGRVFVNPSLESDNAFAAEVVAASGQPGQILTYVHPKQGRVTTERTIWLS